MFPCVRAKLKDSLLQPAPGLCCEYCRDEDHSIREKYDTACICLVLGFCQISGLHTHTHNYNTFSYMKQHQREVHRHNLLQWRWPSLPCPAVWRSHSGEPAAQSRALGQCGSCPTWACLSLKKITERKREQMLRQGLLVITDLTNKIAEAHDESCFSIQR